LFQCSLSVLSAGQASMSVCVCPCNVRVSSALLLGQLKCGIVSRFGRSHNPLFAYNSRMPRFLSAVLLSLAPLSAQAPPPFRIESTTIAEIPAAFRNGSLTCRSLVEQYLARIEANDKRGAALNAIVQTNPDALKAADDLDRRFGQSGPVGPMHCVPVLL